MPKVQDYTESVIEWFESLLEQLEKGKIEDAIAAVRSAIKMLKREL